MTKTPNIRNFDFMADNYVALLDKYSARNLRHMFKGKRATKAQKLMAKAEKKPHKFDPVLSKLRPDTFFGSISETLQRDIGKFHNALASILLGSQRKKSWG